MLPELHSLMLSTDGPLFATLLKRPLLTFHVFSFLLRAREPFSSPSTQPCPYILWVNARISFPASYFVLYFLLKICKVMVLSVNALDSPRELKIFVNLNLS